MQHVISADFVNWQNMNFAQGWGLCEMTDCFASLPTQFHTDVCSLLIVKQCLHGWQHGLEVWLFTWLWIKSHRAQVLGDGDPVSLADKSCMSYCSVWKGVWLERFGAAENGVLYRWASLLSPWAWQWMTLEHVLCVPVDSYVWSTYVKWRNPEVFPVVWGWNYTGQLDLWSAESAVPPRRSANCRHQLLPSISAADETSTAGSRWSSKWFIHVCQVILKLALVNHINSFVWHF